MIIDLCQSIVVHVVSLNDPLVDSGMCFLQPGCQRWPDIETHHLEVTCFSVGFIAFSSNFFVIIGVRVSAKLIGNDPGKRILPGRLVEMPVGRYIYKPHLGIWILFCEKSMGRHDVYSFSYS